MLSLLRLCRQERRNLGGFRFIGFKKVFSVYRAYEAYGPGLRVVFRKQPIQSNPHTPMTHPPMHLPTHPPTHPTTQSQPPLPNHASFHPLLPPNNRPLSHTPSSKAKPSIHHLRHRTQHPNLSQHKLANRTTFINFCSNSWPKIAASHSCMYGNLKM